MNKVNIKNLVSKIKFQKEIIKLSTINLNWIN